MTATLDLTSDLGQRLLRAGGTIESGQIANMRLYLQRVDTVHVRIVGEDRTLCGRSLVHHDQWAWQFIHRGQAGMTLPSGIEGRNGCKVCQQNPIVVGTHAVVVARRQAFLMPEKRRRR